MSLNWPDFGLFPRLRFLNSSILRTFLARDGALVLGAPQRLFALRTPGLVTNQPHNFEVAAHGQKYDPVDSKLALFYKESQSGQILEEGITESGAMVIHKIAKIAVTNSSIHAPAAVTQSLALRSGKLHASFTLA